MIDSRTVLVCTPSREGRTEIGYTGGLASCASNHMFGNMRFLVGVSDIRLARNTITHSFLRDTQYEWIAFIDDDIGFSADDFRVLMDYPIRDAEADATERNPEGTTLTEDGHALIVTCEYSKKQDDLEPARFGLGFTRIHRSVFERLSKLDDPDGKPIVNQYLDGGELKSDFFINGAIEAGHWRGEDTGFFLLCKFAEIRPRIEKRTKLLHVGRKVYPYVPS